MSTVNAETEAASHDAAVQPKTPPPNTFEGTLVSLTGNHLVMSNLEGKKYAHSLARDAQLTCDGTVCTSEALKAGRKIRVTTRKDDRNVATGIETLDQQAEFAQCC